MGVGMGMGMGMGLRQRVGMGMGMGLRTFAGRQRGGNNRHEAEEQQQEQHGSRGNWKSVRESKRERESERVGHLIPGIFKCFLGIYTWNREGEHSTRPFLLPCTYRSITRSRHVLLSSVHSSAGQLQQQQQHQQQGQEAFPAWVHLLLDGVLDGFRLVDLIGLLWIGLD